MTDLPPRHRILCALACVAFIIAAVIEILADGSFKTIAGSALVGAALFSAAFV